MLYWIGSKFILYLKYLPFMSFSTIGFGDLMPGHSVLSGRDGSQKKLIITSAYIIGGMALIAMSFNLGIIGANAPLGRRVTENGRLCGTQ